MNVVQEAIEGGAIRNGDYVEIKLFTERIPCSGGHGGGCGGVNNLRGSIGAFTSDMEQLDVDITTYMNVYYHNETEPVWNAPSGR